MLRQRLVRLHRYLGLAAAFFVVSAGLTGSLLAWNDPLERVFAPGLFVIPSHPQGAKTLDPFLLRERAAAAFPDAQLNDMPLRILADEPAVYGLEFPSGDSRQDDQAFLDPVDGKVLGSRHQGDLRQGLQNLMPFIYSIHESLALGEGGALILGVASLIWLIQCFVGGYLTLPYARVTPARTHPVKRPPWVKRWATSWKLRISKDVAKTAFNVHTAGSLWLWALLFIFAASAMSFNLPAVYKPIVAHLLGVESHFDSLPDAARKERPARISWRQAYEIGVSAIQHAAADEGFQVISERLMMLHKDKHLYEYRVQTSRDVEARGNTQVWIDADTGRVLGIDYPTGTARGNKFTTWIEALHEAMVGGVLYKMVVSLFGLFVATLGVTGVIIWFKKRKSAQIVRAVSSRRNPAS